MIRPVLAALMLILPAAMAQVDPDPITKPINDLIGDFVPPATEEIYDATGQNISREDIRLSLDLNITKGGVGVLGLLLGSGKAELEAKAHLRGEMRIISSDRIRAAVEGENAYSISAQNATALSQLYVPAEVFRASLSAEAIAAFKEQQEKALRDYLVESVPELELVSLAVNWENVSPITSLSDFSLTEPPIVVTLDASLRYLRVESIPSLLGYYLDAKRDDEPPNPKKQYISQLKEDNSDPLRARDFFAAAAFSQLLNLSMQPGWSLEINIALPRGYSIEYANQIIELDGERRASIYIDAHTSDQDVREVLVFSLTHRKGVVTALFFGMLGVIGLLNLPTRWAYSRYRLPFHRERLATDS